MKQIICFEYSGEDCSDAEIVKLLNWYKYYHKLYICYKWKYKRTKKLKLVLNMVSITLIVVGGIAGTITANAIILGTISGVGVIIQGYMTKTNITNKVEMYKFAYTSYNKVLTQIQSFLNGIKYEDTTFLSDMVILDGIITDLCPPINGMSNKYEKIYGP